MKGKMKNMILIFGITFNVILVLFFVYLYSYSIPRQADLFLVPVVSVPKIDDQELKDSLSGLKKIEGIPIRIDENELGKDNPYNP